MFARILVPLDGSPRAERALEPAQALARLSGAPLCLLRVVDVSQASHGVVMAFSLAPQQVLAAEEVVARQYLDAVRARLAARGLWATAEVRRGPAARAIAALTRPDDVVVMATNGRSGLSRFFLGSVADEVVRRAASPVLLVRPDPRPAPRAGKRWRALTRFAGRRAAVQPGAELAGDAAALLAPAVGPWARSSGRG
jgi:nucleotide-binding universal stress UspA family protein